MFKWNNVLHRSKNLEESSRTLQQLEESSKEEGHVDDIDDIKCCISICCHSERAATSSEPNKVAQCTKESSRIFDSFQNGPIKSYELLDIVDHRRQSQSVATITSLNNFFKKGLPNCEDLLDSSRTSKNSNIKPQNELKIPRHAKEFNRTPQNSNTKAN